MKKLLKILLSLYITFLSLYTYAIQNCDYPWQIYSHSKKHRDNQSFKCGNFAKYKPDGSLSNNYYNSIKELKEFTNYYNNNYNSQILKLKNPVEYIIDNMKINTINNKSNNNDDYTKQNLLKEDFIDNKIFINNYFLYKILNKNEN